MPARALRLTPRAAAPIHSHSPTSHGKGAGGSGDAIMARRCELTGKGVQVGNNVSHANNKTKKRFLPNLVDVTLISDALERRVKMRICASTLRTIEHRGGLDKFMLKSDEVVMSDRMRRLRKEILAASETSAAA